MKELVFFFMGAGIVFLPMVLLCTMAQKSTATVLRERDSDICMYIEYILTHGTGVFKERSLTIEVFLLYEKYRKSGGEEWKFSTALQEYVKRWILSRRDLHTLYIGLEPWNDAPLYRTTRNLIARALGQPACKEFIIKQFETVFARSKADDLKKYMTDPIFAHTGLYEHFSQRLEKKKSAEMQPVPL